MNKIPLLFISFFTVLISCQSPEIPELPEKFIGNWFDPEGDEYWSYSFSPHFVIANEKFWNTDKLTGTENDVTLHLSHNGLQKEIKLQLLNDSTIQVEGREFIKGFSGIKRKPKNHQFSLQSGEAVVLGYVKNHQQFYDSTDRIRFIVNDFVLGRQKSHYARIDSSSGQFQVNIELNGPQDISFKYHHNNSWSRIFLNTKDTLIMFIDAEKHGSENDNTQFMGKYADVNYDLYYMDRPYKSFIPPYQEHNKALGSEPEKYYQFRKDFHEKQLEFLKEYCLTNDCSETFKIWYRKNAEVEKYRELMTYSWKSHKYGVGSLTRLRGEKKRAYSALYKDSINLKDSLYEITSLYTMFLNPLSQRMINFSDSLRPRQEFRSIVDALLDLSKQQPEHKMVHEDIIYLNSLSAYATEKDIPEHKKEEWWRLVDNYDEEVKAVKGKAFFDWLLSRIQSVENSKLRDLYLCNYYHRFYIESSNISMADYAFDKMKGIIHHEEYLAKITAEYNNLKDEEKKFNKIEAKMLDADKDGDFLFTKILEENREKVLFLDFWATWCGPCRTDFKLMKDVKEKFIGKDIAFVYLCSQSTEKNWQHNIKKYDIKGDHYLLSTKQYYDLQEKFQVNAFPTYLLIDKKGNVVRDIPRASDSGGLISFLNKHTNN